MKKVLPFVFLSLFCVSSLGAVHKVEKKIMFSNVKATQKPLSYCKTLLTDVKTVLFKIDDDKGVLSGKVLVKEGEISNIKLRNVYKHIAQNESMLAWSGTFSLSDNATENWYAQGLRNKLNGEIRGTILSKNCAANFVSVVSKVHS